MLLAMHCKRRIPRPLGGGGPVGALLLLLVVVALAVAFRNFGTDLAPIFKPSTLLLYIAAQVAGALAAGGTAAELKQQEAN